jgi:predicted GIY-YIG superfamily endonuclease
MTAAPWDGRYVVYRCYHSTGALLYVGCTRRGEQRWREHQGDRRSIAWADKVARISVRIFRDEDSALAAESAAIRSESPIHNVYRGYTRRLKVVSA